MLEHFKTPTHSTDKISESACDFCSSSHERGTVLTLTIGKLLVKRSLTAAPYLVSRQAVTKLLLQKPLALRLFPELMLTAPKSQTDTNELFSFYD